jgi:hypothetical protein
MKVFLLSLKNLSDLFSLLIALVFGVFFAVVFGSVILYFLR